MNLSSVYKFSPFLMVSHILLTKYNKANKSKDFSKKLVSVFLEFRKEFNFKDSLRLTKKSFLFFSL